MTMGLLQELIQKKTEGIRSFVVLIDPDKIDSTESLTNLVRLCMENRVDYFFVGGSFVTNNHIPMVVHTIKKLTSIPVILFPGSNLHIDLNADAILFLSLISGRNPDFLIGQQVLAAPILKNSQIEVMPTGYILIGDNNHSTVSYMSNTTPIPSDKNSVAACTALAGEMLGMKIIYMDAGSGAEKPVPGKMIKKVSNTIESPLIIGGGLNSIEKITTAIRSGADTIVVGNGIEDNQQLLVEIADYLQKENSLKIH